MAKRARASKDMISDLPDDILCQILSFLPSCYSIKTSFLSPRFRNLWQSIPIFDFTDTLCPGNFEKLMEKVLSSHEYLSKLRKFRLWCFGYWYSGTSIPKWIGAATASPFHLEELDIILRCYRVDLPSAFFSCRRLKTLRFEDGIRIPNIPADACFPCLKTFTFISISISIEADNLCNMHVSAVCPVLENFLIKDCSLEILRNNKIKHQLQYVRGSQGDLDSVKVLKQLELHDTDVNPYEGSLTGLLAWILSPADTDGNCRPIFQHLTHLVAEVHLLYLWSDLRLFLEHSPNLISLVLEKPKSSQKYSWAEPGQPATVSRRLPCKNLETVQLNDFNGFQDLELVKYILKNVKVLKNLVLCFARAARLSDEIKASILHEIRVLSQCEVEFR